MQTVQAILHIHGYDTVDEMDRGDCITVDNPGHMPLSIEKIGNNRVSVAHYVTQHGDRMSDPEIVFRTDGDTWTPVRYTQHPFVHQYDKDGLPEVQTFAKRWDRNLKRQGFIEAARQTGEPQQ